MAERDGEQKITDKRALSTKGTGSRSKKGKMKKKENILFIYSTQENKRLIETLAGQHNQSCSGVVNELIAAFRTKREPSFETVIPKYVRQADEWKRRRC